MEIVDRDGLDRLSMRRVAEALGVGTMTLYGYFRDKDELLDALIDAAVGDERPTLSGSWREQLRQLVRVAHQNLTAHPSVVEIRFRQPVLRPEALRFGEAGMESCAPLDSSPTKRREPSVCSSHTPWGSLD